MKIQRMYRPFLRLPWNHSQEALEAFKERAWSEPAEEDALRDTAIDRKRLEFIKRLVDDGKLSDG